MQICGQPNTLPQYLTVITMSRFLFLDFFLPLTLSVVLRDINLNLTDFLISIILIFLKVRHKFRRRFHRAVFAHFTHTVRSLKMTDFYLYFCRLRSRFCRLRSRFFSKNRLKIQNLGNFAIFFTKYGVFPHTNP